MPTADASQARRVVRVTEVIRNQTGWDWTKVKLVAPPMRLARLATTDTQGAVAIGVRLALPPPAEGDSVNNNSHEEPLLGR
jgi:hypothetical protein